MGLIHNELRRGPWSKAIKNALGDTREGGVERYGETLQPVQDIWSQPEWAFLRDELLWCVNFSQAAVVGEFGAVGVVNPAGSNRLLIVERASYRSAVAAIEVNTGSNTEAAINLTLASVQSLFQRDLRNNPGQGRVVFGSDVATGSIVSPFLERGFSSITEMHSFTDSVPFVLPPGFGFVVFGNVVNTQILVNLSGRERAALPGELTR